ncbi:MAG: hypothetical protein LBE13_13115 [Bacteroidales bacterium]|nr:hypothetical protein [Bacteroidales bacterium]
MSESRQLFGEGLPTLIYFLRALFVSLRQQGDDLRTALKAKSGNNTETALVIHNNYEDMPEWIEKNLVGRLILHPRAIHPLNKALFQDIQLVYQALILLENYYRNMWIRIKGAKEE